METTKHIEVAKKVVNKIVAKNRKEEVDQYKEGNLKKESKYDSSSSEEGFG